MCDSWTRKDGDKQPFPVASSPPYCSCSLHPFIFLPPPLSAPIFFFSFSLIISIWLFFPLCWPPPTRLQPTSCQRAERWAGRGRSELQSYTKFSGSLAEMWRAEKWNTGLTERVNLNYRKTLRQSLSVLHLWLFGIRSSSVSPSALCLASQQLSFILFLSGWFKVSARERSSACDEHAADYAVFLSNLPGCL